MTQNILAKSSVLVLNTSSKYRKSLFDINKPVLTDLNGRAMNCTAFTIPDDVQVFGSCAVTYKGQFFVYGGYDRKRQIAKVTNKSLRNVGSLPFNFKFGGCTSTTNKIVLCFHVNGDKKTCYKTTNPTGQFEKTRKSKYLHRRIKFASSECKFFIQTLMLVYFSQNACLWQLVS